MIFGISTKKIKSWEKKKKTSKLINALSNDIYAIRRDAAEALGNLKETEAVDPLLERLNDKDRRVRFEAIKALGNIGDSRAEESLIKLLKESNLEIRFHAANSLEKIGWDVSDNENTVWYYIAKKNWKKCAELGALAVPILIQTIKNQKILRDKAFETLLNIGEKGCEPLIRFMTENPMKVIPEMVIALGKNCKGDAVPYLIKLLDKKNRDIKIETINALGNIRDQSTIEPLVKLLNKNRKDTIINDLLVKTIKKKGKDAIPFLSELLLSPDKSVRKKVSCLLEEYDWNPSKDLKGINYYLGMDRVERLYEFGSDAVVPLLKWLTNKKKRPENIKKIWNSFGESALNPLLKASIDQNSENRDIRFEALIALGYLEHSSSIDPLLGELKKNKKDNLKTIVSILSKMKVRALLDPLYVELEKDQPFCLDTVIDVIIELDGKKAIEPLKNKLNNCSFYEKERVLHYLSKLGDADTIIDYIKGETIIENIPYALDCLAKISSMKSADFIINYLCEYPFTALNPELYISVFGDYHKLIIQALTIERGEKSWTSYGNSHYQFNYKIKKSDKAIKKLCSIQTPVSSNILNCIKERKKIEVFTEINCSFGEKKTLSFETQKKMAKEELIKRGNPPYNREIYKDKKTWIILEK